MNEYTYDSTTISLYSTESYGDVTVLNVTDDYGSIGDAPTNLEAESNLSQDSYGEISISEDHYPFGSATISGATPKVSFSHGNFVADGTAYLASTAVEGIRKFWVGTGSLFEMGGGMERSSAFWVGSGGLTVSGTCEVTTTLDWNEFLFVPFTTEDLGAVDAVPSLLDFGDITSPKSGGEESWGFVYNTDDVRGATAYCEFNSAPWAEFNTYSFTTDRTGSGGLFAASGLSETKTSTEFGDKTTLFSLTGGEIYSKTSREIMSGNASFGSAGIEKFVHEFNEESGFTLETEDNGLVWYGFSETEDLGTTTKPVTAGEYDNGGIIWNNVEANTGTYEFVALYDIQGDGTYARYWEGEGSIHITGQDFTTNSPHWTASGSLFGTGGAAECRTDSVVGGETTLFNWSGAYSNLKFQYHWTGSGSLPVTGGVAILRTYGYDDTATIGYSTGDWGSIEDSPVDSENWGLVTEGWLSENWWYIWHEGVATSMGGLTIRTDPKVINDSTPENYFDPTNPGLSATEGHNFDTYSFTWGHGFVQSGNLFSMGGASEAVGYQPVEDIALFTWSGAYTNLQATFREIGSGAISRIGGGAERVTFDYNESSIVPYSTDDNGLITDAAVVVDQGNVADIQEGEDDYGSVLYSSIAYPLVGSYSISNLQFFGETYSFQRRYIADPVSIFTALGAVESKSTTEIGEDTSLGDLSGAATEYVIFREIGSGSISRIGGGVEKVVFDYSDSTVVPFSSEDSGLVIDAATTDVDLGDVTEVQYGGEENYGLVTYTSTANSAQGTFTFSLTRELWTQAQIDELNPEYTTKPYGTFPQVGDEKTQEEAGHLRFIPVWGQTGSGSLFSVGGASECVTVEPNTTGIFQIVGGDYYIGSMVVTASFREVGSGAMSRVGGAAESVTFDYNESSIVTFTSEDVGLVTDATNYQTDHFDDGSVALPQEAENDYGSVIYGETVYPVTGLIDLYTAPEWIGNTYRFVWRAPAGGGSIPTVGGAAECVSTTEFGDSTTLFDIYTSPAGIGNTYSFCWNYTGYASVPTIGGAAESITYDYNENSIVVFTTDDSGLITDAATVFDNRTDITAPQSGGEEDYGWVFWTSTVLPLTGTLQTSGTSPSAVVFRDPTQGGSLFSAGGASECVSTTELGDATTLFDIYTAPAYIGNTYSFVWNAPPGTGGLFSLNGVAESISWAYNESSTIPYGTEDNGLIVDSVTVVDDYGSVVEPQYGGEYDQGQIIFTSTATPFGSLNLSLTRARWTQAEIDELPLTYETKPYGTFPSAGDEKTQEESGDVRFIPIWGQIGEGSLYSIGGAAECVGYQPTEDTALFDIFTAPQFIGQTYRYAWSYVGYYNLPTIGGAAESVTFDYNESSINVFSVDDEGNIVDNATVFGEYGDLNIQQGEEDYGLTVHTSTVYPLTGTLQTSGIGADSVVFRDPTTGGSLFSAGGSVESKTSTEFGEDTSLGDLSGTGILSRTKDWVGSGSLFTALGAAESVTFDYNESSIVTVGSDDYGLITDAATTNIDQGGVADIQEGEDDHGSIIYTETVYPVTGLVTLTTAPQFINNTYSFCWNFVSDSGSLFTAGGSAESATVDWESTGLFDIFTAPAYIGNTYSFVWNAPPGTGGLFSIVDAAECVTWNYAPGPVIPFSTIDWGAVTDLTHPTNDVISYGDFGLFDEDTEDYGFVIYTSDIISNSGTYTLSLTRARWTQEEIDELNPDYLTEPYGTFPQVGDEKTQEESGDIKYEPSYAHEGSGSIFTIGGASESVVYQPTEDTVLFTAFTTPQFIGNTYRFCWNAPFVEGGLFGIGGCVEARTYNYNDSASVSFSSADYGLVTDATHPTNDAINYGSISDPTSDGEEDYESIIYSQAVDATAGTYTYSGAVTQSFSKGLYTGVGSLFSTGGAGECVSTTEFGEDTSLGDLGGAGSQSSTVVEIGSGSIFRAGGAAECRTYDYDQNAIVVFTSTDHGLVVDSVVTSDDQGSVDTIQSGGEYDYGSVLYSADAIPVTGTYVVDGSVSTAFTFGNFTGSGSLFTAGGSAESSTYSPENDTCLYDIFTAPQFIGNTYSFVWNAPHGSGGLFSVGGCVEVRTYAYNESASQAFSTEDNGLISDAVTTTDDHGDFGYVGDDTEDHGQVWLGATNGAAANGFLTFGGEVFEIYKPSYTHFGEGSLFTALGAAESFTTTEFGEDTSLGDLSGTHSIARTFSEVGIGSIFTVVGGAESRTYNYDINLLHIVSPSDNGLITDSVTVVDDQGTVHPPQDGGEVDNGIIWLGLGSLLWRADDNVAASGEIHLGLISDTVGIARTFGHIASGSLFATGGAAEVVAYDYEDTTLYDIFTAPQFIGNTYSFSWQYYGSGNINSLGGAAESRTWHYSDTLPSELVVDDEGNVVDATTVFADYGDLGVKWGGEEDYGSNNTLAHPGLAASGTYTISGVANTPFVWREGCEGGTYLVSGEGIERPTTALTGEGTAYIYTAPQFVGNTYAFTWGHGFVQSGSLFSAGGAAESTTTNPPEDTLLYTVAGTRISERQTFAESGSGSITLSGAAVERQTDEWIGSGNVTFSGAGAESKSFANFDGSGSLFTAGGAVEMVAVLEGGIGLWTYSGSGIEKHTERYIGSGSATVSGEAIVSIARAPYIGSGSITLSGTKAESFTPAPEIGTGSIFTIGGASESATVDYESTYLFNLVGDTHYVFSLRVIGSGSLFTSSGAAESTTTNPPEDTALFAVGGTKAESFTHATHVGSGSITLSGAGSENYTGACTGSGTATITGEADLIYRVRYFGSGSLFTAGGAAESVTTNPPESTSLHQIGGTRVEKAVFREIGSGSVTLSGTASTRYIPHITGSGTYTVGGACTFKVRYILTGSGNVFTAGGAAEAVGTNPPEDIALFVWSGISENQWSPSWVGQGSYFTSGEIPEPLITKHWTASGSLFSVGGAAESFSANIDGIGLYEISGSGSQRSTVSEVGSGSLWTASGASESIGTNPPESTVLYTYVGAGIEKHTERWIGSGSTTFSGAVSDIQRTFAESGSGSIIISGSALERQTDDWVGSGSLFTAGGSAESTTTNPPENTVLYTWTGAGTEKHTENWVGSGSATVSGAVSDVQRTFVETGSGSLFTALGAAESISTSEISTGIFTVSGDGAPSTTRPFIGSGSITISGTKAESFTPAPEVGTGTATFSGEAFIRWIPSWIGSGTATIYGQVTDIQITKHWTGSGSLFTAGGSAESITTNPPEDTLLYTVAGNVTESTTTATIPGSGTATFSGESRTIFTPNNIGSGSIYVAGNLDERQTDHYHGSGTATISGDSDDTRARAFEGSGSLFTASGAAESATVDYEDTTLYDIFGHGAEAFVRKGYVGSGSFSDITGEVTDVKLTHADPAGDVDYVVSGEVTDIKRTFGYIAPYGTLFAFSGGVESATVDYENILLTTIGGSADDKFVRAAYIGEGTITLSGESLNELRTFEPPFMFATII